MDSKRRALLMAAPLLYFTTDGWGGTPQPSRLFTIARSTNRNVLHYDLKLSAKGELELEEPVVAYWVMLAEDGRREELTWLERRVAYGFSITSGVGHEGFDLRLKAFAARPVRVRRGVDRRLRARVEINGCTAHLERIFVQADDSGIAPSVRHVDVFGRELTSNRRVSERILPA